MSLPLFKPLSALLLFLTTFGCAVAPLRMREIPKSIEERRKLYSDRHVRVEEGQAFAGSEKMDMDELRKHLRATGDLSSGKALEGKPHWAAMGVALAAGGLAAAWGVGSYGKEAAGTNPQYNPFESVPVALLMVEVDLSFTLFSKSFSSVRRAADQHNARLQKTLGIETDEGRYAEAFDRWWWRIPAVLLVGGAYALGRAPQGR